MKQSVDLIRRMLNDRQMTSLLLMVAFVMTGSGVVAPILSLYAQSFGVPNTIVGLLVTIFGIGRLVANLPAGMLSQRIGRKPLLIGGPALVAVASAAAAITDNFAWLVFWRGLQGFGSGIYVTASMAALADISSPTNRAANIALYQSFFMFGATIGPAIGGYAAGFFGYAAPFWLYAAMTALAGVLALSFRDTLGKEVREKQKLEASDRRRIMTAPFTAICIVSLMTFFTRTTAIFQLMPFIGHDTFHLGIDAVGVALTVNAVVILAVTPLSVPLINRIGARAMVFWSTIGMAATIWGLYAATSLAGFWIAVVLFGIVSGASYPATGNYTIAALDRRHYGPGSGLQRTFGDVGYAVGPVLTGAISDVTGGGLFAGVALNVALLIAVSVFFLVGSAGGIRADHEQS